MAVKNETLISLDTLRRAGAASIVLGEGTERRDLLLLHHGGAVRAYENTCPHQGTPLEGPAGRFFDKEGKLLVCSTHGARFRPKDGHCVSGPCAGRGLTPVAVTVGNGEVRLCGKER